MLTVGMLLSAEPYLHVRHTFLEKLKSSLELCKQANQAKEIAREAKGVQLSLFIANRTIP